MMKTPQTFILSFSVEVCSPDELERLVGEIAADTGMSPCSISHNEAMVQCTDDADFEQIYHLLTSQS